MFAAQFCLTLATLTPLASNDNIVEWNGVSHLHAFDRVPQCPVDGEAFTVSFQTFDFDLTSAQAVVVTDATTYVPAAYSHDRGIYDVWNAVVPATVATGSLEYYFELTDGTDTDFLGPGGMSDSPPASGWTIDFGSLSHAPLGASVTTDGGAVFKVWAAGAATGNVAGEFNGWNTSTLPMSQSGEFFTAHVPNVDIGDMYKYVFDRSTIPQTWKPDARARGLNPSDNYNSHVYSPATYTWGDGDFRVPPFEEMILYQLHVGTFSGRNDGGNNEPGTYRDVVDLHLDHLVELGINMVQLLPITEFPTDHSGGYNPVTQWAPEWKYGHPDDLKYMIDRLHQAGIGVTLDIVWNHFSGTDNYLWKYTGDTGGVDQQIYFGGDGTSGHFETPWGSQSDFARQEVSDYFADSAMHWIEEYHFDGFRSDATDYMHTPNGQASGWPLMQRFNNEMDRRAADKISYAEQLPDNSYFTRPTVNGGAGFDSQYHDRHKYAMRNAIFDAAASSADMGELRQTILGRLNDGNGNLITSEIAGVSQTTTQLVKYFELHDEAWGGENEQKRMPVWIDTTFPHDDEYARGRTLVGHAVNFFSPGIPAFLMGSEFLEDTAFGSNAPSTPEARLDWTKPTTYADYLLAFKDMIRIRKENPAFRSNAGAQVNHLNESLDILTLHRWDGSDNDILVVISLGNANRFGYRVGFPQAGLWNEIFNSQASVYGGNGEGNGGSITTEPIGRDGYGQSALITVPRMSATVFRLATCLGDGECVDGSPCTAGTCAQGRCTYAEPDEPDIVLFTDCHAGPNKTPDPQINGGCVSRCLERFDEDDDLDVDLRDFATATQAP